MSKEVLKMALEALEFDSHYGTGKQEAIIALREALADQPAQQCRTDGRCQYAIDSGAEGMGHCPKGKCVMPAQQEPVAWISHNAGLYHFKPDQSLDPLPLYLAPPAQRTWVGLTDEEKSDIWCVVTNRDFVTEDTHVYADAIEAKLKEKNT